MTRKNVAAVVAENLCVSCGICAAVCPKKCVVYERTSDGLYAPKISDSCVDCGICFEFCPGRGADYDVLRAATQTEVPLDPYVGEIKATYTLSAKDEQILNASTSGGVVTALTQALLKSGEYDRAFLLDSFDFSDAARTVEKTADSDLLVCAKSRYVPALQTDAVRYILENRHRRVILVGTPCFIQSIARIIAARGLERENYLLIGLFCDKTLTYNVWDYFAQFETNGEELRALYFRTKENGGWPGGLGLEYANGETVYRRSAERMMVKTYFMPERCLYCVDKLNRFADISVGDNYTQKNRCAGGSSSVILRTERGMRALAANKSLFTSFSADVGDIAKSQKIVERRYNRAFQELKVSEILIRNPEFPLPLANDAQARYDALLEDRKLGAAKDFAAIKERVDKKRAEREKAAKRRNNIWRRVARKVKRVLKAAFKK